METEKPSSSISSQNSEPKSYHDVPDLIIDIKKELGLENMELTLETNNRIEIKGEYELNSKEQGEANLFIPLLDDVKNEIKEEIIQEDMTEGVSIGTKSESGNMGEEEIFQYDVKNEEIITKNDVKEDGNMREGEIFQYDIKNEEIIIKNDDEEDEELVLNSSDRNSTGNTGDLKDTAGTEIRILKCTDCNFQTFNRSVFREHSFRHKINFPGIKDECSGGQTYIKDIPKDLPNGYECKNKLLMKFKRGERIESSEENNKSSATESSEILTTVSVTENEINSTTNEFFYRQGRRQKNCCFYCKTMVTDFARHTIKQHRQENDVQNILSFPANTKERKELLARLRKKGNFSILDRIQKPVKRSLHGTRSLPCSHCLGFFSRKYLWKHRKTCNENVSSKSHQVDAQNFMLKHLKIDEALRTEVFPKMYPDDVSLTAKTDRLICELGAWYCKLHREASCIPIVSKKMRDLARLVTEVQKLKPELIDLFEILQSANFELLVQATKNIAKYDRDESSTLAINMGTSLRQCCDLALNKNGVFADVLGAETETGLKRMIDLINKRWKFEVSHQALKQKYVEDESLNTPIQRTHGRKVKVKKARILVKWTDDQKQLVSLFFADHIQNKRAPKKEECEELINNHKEIMHNKDWLKIKVFVQNKYSTKF